VYTSRSLLGDHCPSNNFYDTEPNTVAAGSVLCARCWLAESIRWKGRHLCDPDLQKVIVERPRRGSFIRGQNTALRLRGRRLAEAVDAGEDYDSGSPRASSARRDKRLNENLEPLRRYLRRQVGRPWRNVLGEIRAVIDTRSAIGLHVLQHVPDLVSIHTFLKDGVVYERRWSWGWPATGLYVHPVSGILRYAKDAPHSRWRDPRSDEQEPDFVPVTAELEYQSAEN